jgi:hypothetical protein
MRSDEEDSKGDETMGPRTSRRSWTTTEDAMLYESVEMAKARGEGWMWSDIAARVGRRNGRQCRQRYEQYLSPEIVRGEWTEEEDVRLRELHEEYGPKWAHIARTFFPGRSSQMVKNRWNCHVARRGRGEVRRGGVRRGECGLRGRQEPPARDRGSCGSRVFGSAISDSEFAPVSEVEIWTDEEENMVDIVGFGIW